MDQDPNSIKTEESFHEPENQLERDIFDQKLVGRLIDMNYDLVSYCDLRQEKFYLRETKDEEDFGYSGIPYADAVLEASGQIDPAQKNSFLRNMDLGNIRRELEDKSVYTVYYAKKECRTDLPGAPKKQIKNSIFYLDGERNILVSLAMDVTEIFERDRRNREQMADALKAAKQASYAKSNFLARMSHEIRTPLNAIIGMDAIAAQSIANREKTADCISKIGLSARYLLSLINDILDMSRIESGKMLLKNESFSFSEFMASVSNIIYPQTASKGLEYECTVSGEADDLYIGDEMKLRQVLVNVLGNAVKFTQKGRISLDVSVVSRTPKGVTMRFVVNDTGCGIAEENLSAIFEAFEQVDSSTTSSFGGSGLGLAITKNLLGLMGGSISVRSILGVGSEFTMDVPLTPDPEAARPMKPYFSLKNLYALIVDDDLLVCEETEGVLRDIGMNGEWVTSGQDAEERVRERLKEKRFYDFILIDWKMPVMDGIETTRQIRKMVGPDVTIIIVTAYDWQAIETEARAAGANILITKPLLKSNLISAFEKALGHDAVQVPEQQEFDFTGKMVLIAEDNEINAEIAKSLLENKNFHVEIASNGIKALQMFTQNPVGYYDAILMDVRMPIMDGLQATVNIRHWNRKDAKTIPIIAMTANAFDEDRQKSRAAGMNAHLSKPIEPELLYSTLSRLIERNDTEG